MIRVGVRFGGNDLHLLVPPTFLTLIVREKSSEAPEWVISGLIRYPRMRKWKVFAITRKFPERYFQTWDCKIKRGESVTGAMAPFLMLKPVLTTGNATPFLRKA